MKPAEKKEKTEKAGYGTGEAGAVIGKKSSKNKAWIKALFVFLCAAVVALIVLLITRPWEILIDPDSTDYIDLSSLGGSRAYKQVDDMMNLRSEKYVGKTVKVKGQYRNYYSADDQDSHFIYIKDAAGCCSMGIAFTYDDVFPKENDTIVIEGTFERHEEAGKTIYRISAGILSVV
jgi:hypothetical protein